jgi:hypothetical protein
MSGRELRENPYLTPLIANIAKIAKIAKIANIANILGATTPAGNVRTTRAGKMA